MVVLGASNLSEPLRLSSLRMANESLRNAPMHAALTIVTNPSTNRAAIVASVHFRVAVTRGFPSVPSPVSACLS